jgi:hypothetical protein
MRFKKNLRVHPTSKTTPMNNASLKISPARFYYTQRGQANPKDRIREPAPNEC